MRPILALLVPIILLGGLQLSMELRPRATAPTAAIAATTAAGKFTIEISLTFDAGPDEFALNATDAPSLVVRLQGRELLRRTDAVEGGRPIQITDVQGLVEGANELYIEATPMDASRLQALALRVQVLRDGSPIATETLWAEPGESIRGSVALQIPTWADLSSSNESL